MPPMNLFGNSNNPNANDYLPVQEESPRSERTARLLNRNFSKEAVMAPDNANDFDSESDGESRREQTSSSLNQANITLMQAVPSPKTFKGRNHEALREWHCKYKEYLKAAKASGIRNPSRAYQIAGAKGVYQMTKVMRFNLRRYPNDQTAQEVSNSLELIGDQEQELQGSGYHLLTLELIEKYLALLKKGSHKANLLKETLEVVTQSISNMMLAYHDLSLIEEEIFLIEETINDKLQEKGLLDKKGLYKLCHSD